jgi:hypothetical protein
MKDCINLLESLLEYLAHSRQKWAAHSYILHKAKLINRNIGATLYD